MARVFLAVMGCSELEPLLRQLNYEVVFLTNDSILDNIESLRSSHVVVVDSSSPSWVLRESKDDDKLLVAFNSIPESSDVIAYSDDASFPFLMKDLFRFCVIRPVDQTFMRDLAALKVKYPLQRLKYDTSD